MTAERARHPLFARFYRAIAPAMDRGGLGEQRRALLEGLSGEVLEVGVGPGGNFPHYPSEVTRLVAVEPEPLLREEASAAAAEAPVPVEVVDGTGERLPVADESFDAAVVTLVLCSVDQPAAVLRELYRVLRPGGELRFMEHVRADRPVAAAVQRAVDATFWPLLAGGCHTSRDPLAPMRDAGFRIEHLDRLRFGATSIPFPASPHIVGTAVRPAV